MRSALANEGELTMIPSLLLRWHRATRTSRARRGFTLIELLVVVAMVGVLAALAMVGYRKYIRSAQSSEATSMLGSIKAAQESFKSEALSYLPVSSAADEAGLQGNQLYPRAQSALDDAKASWINSSGANYAQWQQLNAASDGTVRFGYGCIAGLPGSTLPSGADVAGATSPNWGAAFATGTPSDPWFIASAVGDRDDDNAKFGVMMASSFTTEIFVYDDTE